VTGNGDYIKVKRPGSQIEYIEKVGLLELFKYIKYLESIRDRYNKTQDKPGLLSYGQYFKEVYTEQK
jgi:hypothetical protein